TDGHHAGVDAVRRVMMAAPALDIDTLTMFAFSSDNWKRPKPEVEGMMQLIEHYMAMQARPFADAGVRLTVIGRRDRLPAFTVAAIEKIEAVTAGGTMLNARLAIDFSGRHALLEAAARAFWNGPLTADTLSQALATGSGYRNIDLLIRTSGEQRLSDFLLWESAYAELWFTKTLWPDFTGEELADAVTAFRSRNRRFGGLPDAMPSTGAQQMLATT
ncbi:MAG: di-trans,poly-cis-decaprenylcistransferase, partial [Anderseniella sp.]|nr:di-trans,poly-cis-decaprenylcistransferase [Anderseniella sp.]